ncbi:MAG: PorV/PorQ family protein [Bacteroidetes bacterium]|nr:PorV/PorQ family protein [Bacteroidota bacterium]
MKQRQRRLWLCLGVVVFVNIQCMQAQVKWAQTGFNFLSVSSDARAGGMGEAVTSLGGYRGALFHNPATMAEMDAFLNASVSMNSWIADIRHITASILLAPFAGNYGVVGVSFQSVDYGEIEGTMRFDNPKGYINTEILKPSALAVGFGYAKMISDRFSVGGQVKFAYQSLGKSIVPHDDGFITKRNVAKGIAFDFGTLFKTGVKSLAFGMSIRNYSKEVKYEIEGFQLPLNFIVGISANILDFFTQSENHSLVVAIDATHPRSHPEQLKFGAEYTVLKAFAFRCGYVTNNSEDNITFGVGVSTRGLGLGMANIECDYSYTPFGVFNNVQRLTVRIEL